MNLLERIVNVFIPREEVDCSTCDRIPLDIDGFSIMTTAQIVSEHIEFSDANVLLRYLYTKDKERDNNKKVGFI